MRTRNPAPRIRYRRGHPDTSPYAIHYAPRNRFWVLAWGRFVRALRRALRQ